MNPNIKVCPHCGEETLMPYTVFPDEVQNVFVEHWVCTKCYNSFEFIYDREKQEYVVKQ